MKTNLTLEQSQRLIELGVAPSKASRVYYVDPYGLDDAIATNQPIFDLANLIELLPKEIKVDGTNYHLNIDFPPIGQVAARYFTEYDELESIAGMMCPELIDALYELLIWVLQNHPDKIKKL